MNVETTQPQCPPSIPKPASLATNFTITFLFVYQRTGTFPLVTD